MINPNVLEKVLARVLSKGGDFSEIFVEDKENLGLSLEDQKIDRVTSGRDIGAGLRLVKGSQTYFGYSEVLSDEALFALADTVAGAGLLADTAPIALTREILLPQPVARPLASEPALHKVGYLKALDSAARSAGAEVVQVMGGYGDVVQQVQIANSKGLYVEDTRTRVRLFAQAIAKRGEVIQTGFESVGGHMGLELLETYDPAEVGRSAAAKALAMLDSSPAPSGPMTVVLANGFGGVLFHEAAGHGMEADAVQKKASIFAGKVGEFVASPAVTLVDDGTLGGSWGTGSCDDEGTPSNETVLVEQGRLTRYMTDRLRAGATNEALSGNGRRQSFRHLPIPRMTNTYIRPGHYDPGEIIGATDYGFYAASLSGGQVEPATGNFVFGVSEGYLIEKGKITRALRGATLIGNGAEALKGIDMVGNDFDIRPGTCGKDGQSVPVGTGQPTVRIQNITVGGTA